MATIALRDLVSAELVLPLTGAWQLNGEVSLEEALSGAVTLDLGDTKLSGTVVNAGTYGGAQTVRVVGGAGKLGAPVTPKGYQNPTTRQIAQDIVAAGEQLDASSTLTGTLPYWATIKQPMGSALATLAEKLGLEWRVLAGGKIWLGTDAWSESKLEHVVMHEDKARGVLVLALEAPALFPGVILDGRKIGRVRYRVADSQILTEAWTV